MVERRFTATELADVKLPGLPATRSGIWRWLKTNGIDGRKRTGRGGGRVYAIADLPRDVTDALAERVRARDPATLAALGITERSEVLDPDLPAGLRTALAEYWAAVAAAARVPAAPQAPPDAAPAAERAPPPVRTSRRAAARMDAGVAVLRAFDAFRAASGLAVSRARGAFVEAWNAGAIEAPDWARVERPRLSVRTLIRMNQRVAAQGVAALAGAYGRGGRAAAIDACPEMRDLVVGMLAEWPHVEAPRVHEAIDARFGPPIPSVTAVQRWLRRYRADNRRALLAIADPDAHRSRYQPALGSASAWVGRLNQGWEADSTPNDLMFVDGRYTLVGVIDIYSRSGSIFVTPTSKSVAIATCLRRAILAWGVPEVVVTDQGSDYTSRYMARVFRDLGIDHKDCPPFRPELKPHVERFFRTFAHDLVELLPGFVGHNVSERKAIEHRRSFAERLMDPGNGPIAVEMTAQAFQDFADEWCTVRYDRRVHSQLDGRAPFEMRTGWTGPVRRIADERALDLLLAEAPSNDGGRTVQKKGVEVEGAWFIAPELGAKVGDRVAVRLDPADLGRVFVFDDTGGFLCVAECPARTGIDRAEVAAAARKRAKEATAAARAAAKAAKKSARTKDIVDEIRAADRARAAEVVALPVPARPHDTPALAEAARAAHATDPAPRPRPSGSPAPKSWNAGPRPASRSPIWRRRGCAGT